ncbi:MAG: DNA-directed RNA polymerase subunit beta, partial [Dehalococcoidia bacterium]|nr:DNA-directed RNA polymerase subunit beta [Dehalococcoidia bacterium]
KKKIPITTLLRAIDEDPKIKDEQQLGTNERILALFEGVDTNPDHHYIRATLDREPTQNKEEALLEFYRRLRPGDPPTLDNGRKLIKDLFFNPRRYDLGKVGRYKLDKHLNHKEPPATRILVPQDLVDITREIVRLNNGEGRSDDIDHLGNRRLRTVGELIQNQFRIGLLRMERVVRERMTITDPATTAPTALSNIRPVVAAIKEFFGGSQLSQFMDQTNPLAELTHKRRLSALGPGGLSRDRAGFDVRDVHHSHYGRICPIETPEGPNIGLIGSLATYARVNEYGFIETPYRKVIRELPNNSPELVGRFLRQDVKSERGRLIAPAGAEVTDELAKKLAKLPPTTIAVRPFVSDQVLYLSADEEERYVVAQANEPLDERNHFIESKLESRFGSRFITATPDHVDLMDLSPKQIVSVATSLIPFLEHDDANRALMGSNMQRQAVPLVRPEVALVATGMERQAAHDSGQVVFSATDGVVTSVTADRIVVRGRDGVEHVHPLRKFVRSNQG